MDRHKCYSKLADDRVDLVPQLPPDLLLFCLVLLHPQQVSANGLDVPGSKPGHQRSINVLVGQASQNTSSVDLLVFLSPPLGCWISELARAVGLLQIYSSRVAGADGIARFLGHRMF
jgi:hypothetical protein